MPYSCVCVCVGGGVVAGRSTNRKSGGLGQMKIPLVSDPTRSISNDYGVLITYPTDGDAGITLRGLFIIDPKGIVQQMWVLFLAWASGMRVSECVCRVCVVCVCVQMLVAVGARVSACLGARSEWVSHHVASAPPFLPTPLPLLPAP